MAILGGFIWIPWEAVPELRGTFRGMQMRHEHGETQACLGPQFTTLQKIVLFKGCG